MRRYENLRASITIRIGIRDIGIGMDDLIHHDVQNHRQTKTEST